MPEPMTITRAELVRALRDGQAAALAPATLATACPHSPGGDANERMRAAAWLRAFLRARGVIG